MFECSTTLTENQVKALKTFYRINNASGHCDMLMDIFQIYLSSAHDDTLDATKIKNHFYMIRQIIGLIKELEPAKAVPSEVKILKFNQS